jgi:Zn-dependent protease
MLPMPTLRKLLRACFANAALIYLVASCTLLPALVRMRAENRQFLEDAPRTPTLIENLLLLLAQFIFVLPVILAALNGIAWWALRTCRKSARMWALAASLSLLLTGIGLWSLDQYVNSRFPMGHPPLFAWIIGIHALVGIAGLIAFSPRDSSLAEAQPPRIAGDGTHRYLDTIGIIFQVGATLWLMELYSRWGYQQGLPFTHGLEAWVQWFLVIILATLLHESGHALVGIALGMKLRAFIVGPFQFRVIEGSWTFAFRPTQLLAFSGAAGLVPVDPKESRWNEVAVIAAGPFVNLLTGAVAAALAWSAVDSPWRFLWEYFALFATVSLVAGTVNLIPLRPEGLYSDGARMLQIFRGGPLYDYQRAARISQAGSASPVRPRDFDIAAIDRASTHFTTGEVGLLLHLWATEYYLDRGDLPQARVAFTQAEEVFKDSASDVPPSLHACLVVNAAITRRDAEATGTYWQSMQTKRLDRQDINYWQAKCAFHWSENRFDLARETWKAGNDYLSGLPQTGSNNYDRDCQARLLELIEKHAALHAQGSTKISRQRPTAFATLAVTE